MFTTATPELFFSMYSPPKSEHGYKSAKDRLDEDLRFVSKVVCALDVLVTMNTEMTRR